MSGNVNKTYDLKRTEDSSDFDGSESTGSHNRTPPLNGNRDSSKGIYYQNKRNPYSKSKNLRPVGTNRERLPQITEEDKNISDRSPNSSIFLAKSNGFSTMNNMGPLEDVVRIVNSKDDNKAMLKALMHYIPRNKNINMEEIRKSPTTKLKRYKDAIYYGELQNENRHGKGLLFYDDYAVFEGEFENDLKHGKGIEITGSGCIYEGNFLNNKPDGFGIFLWTNGEIYEGEWKGGYKHGSGLWKGRKGESYMGEWKMGKQEGYGVFLWKNGDRYEGEFKAFLKHGHGTEKFSNGDYYVGNYRNGKPHGYGEYFWADGSYYKGFFRNGLRHGKGIWRSSPEKADEYDGDWLNDKKSGFGIFKWSSGNFYEGEFFDDMRQGFGAMHWIDGSYYKGQWEKGIQNGEGELFLPGKGAKTGVFQNNIFVGNATSSDDEDFMSEKKGVRPGLKLDMKVLSPIPKSHIHSPHTPDDFSIKEHDPFIESIKTLSNKREPRENIERTTKSEKRDKSLKSEKIERYEKLEKIEKVEKIDKYIQYEPLDEIKETQEAYQHDNSYLSQLTVKKKYNKKDKLKNPRAKSTVMRPTLEPRFSPRRPEACLLQQKEWAKWQHVKDKFRLPSSKFDDLSRETVCERIRKLIYPPVWKPPGAAKVEAGKSDLNGSTILIPTNMSYRY